MASSRQTADFDRPRFFSGRRHLIDLTHPAPAQPAFDTLATVLCSGSQLKGIRQQLPPIRSIQLSGSISRLWRPLRTCRPPVPRNSTRARSLTSNAFFRARSRPGLREGAGFFFSGRLCSQSVPKKPATYDAGAPGENRTHITGFGDRCTIHCATGAFTVTGLKLATVRRRCRAVSKSGRTEKYD